MQKNKQLIGEYRTLNLINHFNTQISGPTEYSIAKAVIDSADSDQSISLSDLSERACISQASVSRMIKDIGYQSFQEFKESYQPSLKQMNVLRKLLHLDYFRHNTDLADMILKRAVDNLESSMERIDPEQLQRIITMMLSASSVSFFGDDHVLSDMYTLQLDLLSCDIPSYLFKDREIQNMHCDQLTEKDLAVYLNVSTSFMTPTEKKNLKTMHDAGVRMVGFFQEDDEALRSLFDEYVCYGIPGSYNQGFYSIWMLSQLMSEMIFEESAF